MSQVEIEAALQAAFRQCAATGRPLDAQQQQTILAVVLASVESSSSTNGVNSSNPLDDLSVEQRQILLQFVQEQESLGQDWKIQLLDDWLQGQESGAMQFVRDLYGPQWLERVQPMHLTQYAEDAVLLKVGDRIEVSNSLWEWVQDDGPCSREWISCTVVGMSKTCDGTLTLPASYQCPTNCTIRFDNGTEYEIQGMYEWNRYNWRWQGLKEAG
jgi:hypothetical protein